MTNVLRYSLRNISPQTLKELQEHYPDASVQIKLRAKPPKDGLEEAEFWHLIAQLDWSKTGDDNAVIEPVVSALSKKTFRHICDFADILSQKLFLLDGEIYAQSFTDTELDEDFSADRFLYTRACVVANGKETFNFIRKNPKEMPNQVTFAPLLRIPSEAYKKQTMKPFDHVWAYPIETFSNKVAWSSFKQIQ
ncbi:MAG: DUF4240 domain-containing protein [Saprospiraceae bacterium]|nr:DUF4240 domain-containing protein [Saprospiraceae bacterium]